MKDDTTNCDCTANDCPAERPDAKNTIPRLSGQWLALGVLALIAWVLFYRELGPIARWITYTLFHLPAHTHVSLAVEFFVFEVPKVLLLLTLIVFVVGIVRSFFTPERTRKILAGKRESVGNVLAALLGIVTDLFGKQIFELHAPFAGEVLYILNTPPINAGEPLAFVGAVKKD
jgi:hypothetical protein